VSNPVANRKRAALVVPSGASHFTIRQIVKEGEKTRMLKMQGPPDENSGEVPDSWPVSQFSTQAVLQMWGPGKYRVDWYQANGDRVPETHGESFDVAKPAKRPHRKLAAARHEEDEELPPPPLRPATSAAAAPAMGGQIGIMEMLTLLDRARAEASERDRTFFLQMQQSQAQMIQALSGRGPGADSSASLELMRERMKLEMDQRMFELRREMLERQPDEDPDDDPSDLPPPADMSEAVERIGMSFLSQLEGAAPELVQKMVPRFLDMLRSQGLAPSAEMQARIAQAQNGAAHANGR
jgi:hypothetical protein